MSVVCGLPGSFEKLKVIFKELLSNATIDGCVWPFVSATEARVLIFYRENNNNIVHRKSIHTRQ